ncbi:MAG: hypothetical protein WCI73_08365 [Phycisphaerae bacterium]
MNANNNNSALSLPTPEILPATTRHQARRRASQARQLAAVHAPIAIAQLLDLMQSEKPDTRLRASMGLLKLALSSRTLPRKTTAPTNQTPTPPTADQLAAFVRMADSVRTTPSAPEPADHPVH